MTELLTIMLSRGQNEGIDARVSPPEVHANVRNMRWRKDGRPAKRYGSVAVTTTGLDAGLGYTTQAVNAVTEWQGSPVLAIGSSVRQFLNGSWSGVTYPGYGELSHWGPGRRDIIARDERTLMSNASSGALGAYVFHCWDDGNFLYYSLRTLSGAVVRPPQVLHSGIYPRVIVTTNFIYILAKSGTGLTLDVFDPSTRSITGLASPGTLNATNQYLDGCGRGSDFLIAYQSAASQVTVALFTAVAVPVAVTGKTANTTSAGLVFGIGVVSDATNNVFLATSDNGGHVQIFTWDNGLTTAAGSGTIETDAFNSSQPGLVLESAGVAQVMWGGATATGDNYLRHTRVSGAGATLSAIVTAYNVTAASKPFMGPAYSTLGGVDGSYVWVQTENLTARWADQRTYLLMKYTPGVNGPLHRHLHTPNVAAARISTLNHLSDVLNLGAGYGYLTPLPNAVRVGGSGGSGVGFDAISFRSIFESQRYAARDAAICGRVVQFSGGSLFEYGGFAEETGFSNAPVIVSITGAGGGSLSAGNYLYRAVYEWIDLQGRRHRSTPSDPFLFASGASSTALLTISPMIADSHFAGGAVSLHIYRTLVGQGTYHRVTPNRGPPLGTSTAAAVTYSDVMADTAAVAAEILYTDGGVLDNTLAPPCTFMAVCNGRLWLGGQLDRNVITASKVLVDSEPSQFTDSDSFSVFLPQECTGLASIDGTVVAFARERIYFVSGDGPNDQGVNGSFNPPTELPTDVGCIDWRSVTECSLGVFFQSKRGIFLLPRGFNTPIFIGAEIEDQLAARPIVLSATVVSIPAISAVAAGEITARFVVAADEAGSSTRVLTYDMRTGGWSIDLDNSATAYGLCGTWSDAFVSTVAGSGGAFSSLRIETPGTYVDGASTYIASGFATGDIRPFGVAGFGGFDRVVIMGEYRAASTVQVIVNVDGATPSDVFNFSVTAADAADGTVYLDVTPSIRMGSAIKIQVADSVNGGSGATEGFITQALFIEHETIGKTKRLAAARKA